MSYISDKIAEVRGLGHVIPEGIEELFLAIEAEIGLDKKKAAEKPEEKPAEKPAEDPLPNPFEGERTDS